MTDDGRTPPQKCGGVWINSFSKEGRPKKEAALQQPPAMRVGLQLKQKASEFDKIQEFKPYHK